MFRPLTVLHVAYPFAPVSRDSVGGAEQVLAQLDVALVRSGHRSIVVAHEDSTVFGEHVETPAWDGALDGHATAGASAHAAAIRKAQELWSIDVIHLHGIDFSRYLQACATTTLVTLHLPIEWYPAEMFHLTQGHVFYNCVSESQQKACPQCAQLLACIHNGVATEQFQIPQAKRNFALCLGRICPEKGFHIAIDAAKRARVPLLLAGRVYSYHLHKQYFQNEIVPRLDGKRRFVGVADFRRKRRLLTAARCLLVPSLAAETSCLVAMEALACGTPVIAFPSGALAQIVEHGQTGFLVRTESEMADAIHECPKLDSDRCRQAARTRFDLRKTTQAYLDLYATLAERPQTITKSDEILNTIEALT